MIFKKGGNGEWGMGLIFRLHRESSLDDFSYQPRT